MFYPSHRASGLVNQISSEAISEEDSAMPDDLRSPIKHHLVLHRIDPEQGIRRFYSLMIERDLFGTVRLVRNWGRIGTSGQELVEIHEDEVAAGQALEAVARTKRRRGYRDL
jgi:predicted DNA-binding WGR domain protein